MNKFKISLILLLLFFKTASFSAYAKHQFYEKEYQKYWCGKNNGITEYSLPDRTRIDCLTNYYAIEFDFATKWAEAIGQALYYAKITNKKAGIVLIMEDPIKDKKYLDRVKSISSSSKITIWTVSPNDIINNDLSLKDQK